MVFAGLQDQASLKQLYADSDLCVLTSFAEGVPVVLMEAMAIGIPCVAPRIYGIPELIRHGIDGLLFAPSNVSELVSAIGEVMDNPALWSKMSQSCWDKLERSMSSARTYLSSQLFSANGCQSREAIPDPLRSTDS